MTHPVQGHRRTVRPTLPPVSQPAAPVAPAAAQGPRAGAPATPNASASTFTPAAPTRPADPGRQAREAVLSRYTNGAIPTSVDFVRRGDYDNARGQLSGLPMDGLYALRDDLGTRNDPRAQALRSDVQGEIRHRTHQRLSRMSTPDLQTLQGQLQRQPNLSADGQELRRSVDAVIDSRLYPGPSISQDDPSRRAPTPAQQMETLNNIRRAGPFGSVATAVALASGERDPNRLNALMAGFGILDGVAEAQAGGAQAVGERRNTDRSPTGMPGVQRGATHVQP